MTKNKAREISRIVYIVATVIIITAIAMGLFFENFKLQSPILIRLQSPIVEREMLSPIVEQAEAKEVSNDDEKGGKEATRGEGKADTREVVEQRITGWRGIQIPKQVSYVLDYYGSAYGVDYNAMAKIARCESGFDPSVTGPTEDGGIYQFIPGTWQETRRRMGLDTDLDLRYDLEENVKTGAYKMSKDGFGAWKSSKWCWGVS